MNLLSILPGEGPPDSGSCNYDGVSPKRSSNVAAMDRGFADEAVVVVKPSADEDAVTYPRVKLTASDMDVGGEAWSMLPRFGNFSRN
jgi:hypothetical protein